MRKVLILYKFLPQWRVDFFNLLREALYNENIELTLVYGKLKGEVSKKNDEVDLGWGVYVPNWFLKLGRIELILQPAFKQIKGADLIIVEQANKLLINYFLMIIRKFTKKKLAFWGHGLNLQSNSNSMGNKFKKLYSRQCDWWFAYTNNVSRIIQSFGYPVEKITVVQNAIDTIFLKKEYDNISYKEIVKLKSELNIGNGPIGLYCGGMYKEKRLDFILDACKKIKKEIRDFGMIFIGAGPEDYKIKEAALKYKWIHYVGTKFHTDKVPYFKMADVFLMPGLVGLAILDAFAMQLPIITTNYPYHSPEIEYLENGFNGKMTANSLEEYSNAVVTLLNEGAQLKHLKEGCKISAEKYTIERMVSNFKSGILKLFNS
ncbi:MAG: hypothetical protein Fur0028_02140 [Bacteroidales bacterium]